MKGKSILSGLVLGWLAVTAFAHTERIDSLGTAVLPADTALVASADTVVAEPLAVVADSLVPVAIADSVASVAVIDSVAQVPDSLVQATNLDVASDSLELDSLGLAHDAPILVEEVKEPAKVYVLVPDSVVNLADSIFTMASRLALLPENVRVLADSVGLALRPMMLVDSTDIFADRVKALYDVVMAQVLYEEELARLALPDTTLKVKYSELLAQMRADYEAKINALKIDNEEGSNPLYFRLFAPLTLYKGPIHDAINYSELVAQDVEDSLRLATMTSGKDVRLQSQLDKTLLATYLDKPTLVKMLEDTLMSNQSVSENAIKNTSEGVKLNVPTATITNIGSGSTADLSVDMSVAKPNFWSTKGTFSMQLTESYFSENWYQGGINNLNMLSTMSLEAVYNNKRKVQWINKLDARIGFYQNEGAEIQSNQDLLRGTSKLSLKAIHNWNYTVEAQANTQMMQHFQGDNITLKSRFLAPVDGTLTVGMDYRKNLKKGSISVFPGPISYKMTYVSIDELVTNYGIEAGKNYRHDIGSKLEVNFNYQLAKNISYKTRFYYYSGMYEYVQMDWENTFSFSVSKYLSATLFCHARFDDSRTPNEKFGYFMFKEYLTFGLNYVW